MKRYLVQKYYGGGRYGVHPEYLTDFAAAYKLLEETALANPGTLYRIRAHGKTIGLPLTYTRQDLSKVVAHADRKVRS